MKTIDVTITIPEQFQDDLMKLIVAFERLSMQNVDKVVFVQDGIQIPMYDRSKRMKPQ